LKYSIIIPTLNEEKLLPNLLNQLNPPELKSKHKYEIIISDGGSTDNTVGIATELADKVIVHNDDSKQNISMGRNEGAKHAEGDWLIFLNGDITISDVNKFFSIITTTVESNRYKGITFSVHVNKDEEIFSDKIFLGFYNYYFHLLNIIKVGMGRGECLILPGKLFHKIGGFNSELAAGEDFDLFKRVRSRGRVFYCHEVKIFESPRRYRHYGHLHILLKWLLNSIFVIVKKKSLSREWEEVR
jgi:glycosyltransferase involved in cell wall biosynthesis